ncbi:hypothetical protein EI200_17025 [Peribacillus simplex]|uniref:hypothetical protein n=1 Tax=Peribacillus simplex TaxID=1478 RepID=UPI000F644A52|nr:hypothetical protein EI200_17025 [Peribacillus simplex]
MFVPNFSVSSIRKRAAGNDGGLIPNGFSAIFMTMMTVVFAFQGAEVVGFAAGESEAPEKATYGLNRNCIVGFSIF